MTHGTVFHVAELALALLLFSDAPSVDVRSLRAGAGPPGRLLGIGMPATIALGMAAGAALLTEVEFWEAAIVAAVLAPPTPRSASRPCRAGVCRRGSARR
mgnify:CR=1 FL=1